MARTLCFAIAAICCLSMASAYPWLFVDEYAKTCTTHPTAPDAGHGAPRVDPTTNVYLLQNGAQVGTGCPGSRYQLKITFPQPRRAMVTTTIGTLANGVGDLPAKKCANRMLTSLSSAKAPSNVIVTDWAVPCGATGQAIVQITSATSSSSAFLQQTARVPIMAARACRSTCPLAASG